MQIEPGRDDSNRAETVRHFERAETVRRLERAETVLRPYYEDESLWNEIAIQKIMQAF